MVAREDRRQVEENTRKREVSGGASWRKFLVRVIASPDTCYDRGSNFMPKKKF